MAMRILHITGSIATEAGGVARSVQDTSKALAEAGLEVEILAHKTGHIDLPWKDQPPERLALTLVEPASSGRLASPDMKRMIRERLEACDVLHLHGMWEMLNNYAAEWARVLRKPYVCSIRGMLDPWSMRQRPHRKKFFYRVFENRRLSLASAIHFTAEDELRKAREWVPAGVRTVVVPNIINLGLFIDLPERQAGRERFPQVPGAGPWVLFLSRIHEKKGLDRLIQAFAQLPAELATAQLIIAGTGDDAYIAALKNLARESGIETRVHFVGMIQGKAKAELYRTCEVLAIPTSQENFGLVFPEALACETPVMLTEGVDIHREILGAGAGYLITQEPAQIAATLIEALTHPAENRQRGAAGRRWVLENLQPAAIARQWCAIYASLAAGRPAAARDAV